MTHRMIHTAGWLAASCLLAVMTSAPAQAQSRVRVTIPFAFDAGAETLPAGLYLIERSALTGTSLMHIHNVDRNETIVLATVPAGNRSATYNPRLKFEILAGGHRLSEIWTPGTESGALVPRTKEQSLIAKRAGKVETVTLAMTTER